MLGVVTQVYKFISLKLTLSTDSRTERDGASVSHTLKTDCVVIVTPETKPALDTCKKKIINEDNDTMHSEIITYIGKKVKVVKKNSVVLRRAPIK
jgi:hypothetical protein